MAMAAFQICAQALLASAFAKKDHYKVAVTTARVLQLAVVLGVGHVVRRRRFHQRRCRHQHHPQRRSSTMVIISKNRLIFRDYDCLQIDQFITGTQTINTLAFIFDGEWRGMA
uniref:Uncharacterized protein n=1 Tax=Oryza barthii TaxID=65489 RepID=A0A0D3F6L8_9ORYZ